jgi:hypothetical protein
VLAQRLRFSMEQQNLPVTITIRGIGLDVPGRPIAAKVNICSI